MCEHRAMAARYNGQGARGALRAATSAVHERLHTAPPFLALAQGRLNRDDYADLLSRMAGYYFAVSSHLPIEPARLRLLEDDLAAVEAPSPPGTILPPIVNEEAGLGWRYVVEGSIFGGRVIFRQLDYLFGSATRGRSFFGGTAGGVRHWQTLCAELEATGPRADTLDTMIEGALAAFAAFEKVIETMDPVISEARCDA
jgi:heme oxygenase